MPVTKLKGAFFAIYADSPARSTRSHQPALVTSSSTILQTASSSSPAKKHNTITRKALTTVQAKSVGFPSDPIARNGDKGKAKAVDVKPASDDVENEKKPSVNPKSTVKVTTTLSTSTAKRSVTAKRQFEIFRAPPSPTSASPSGPKHAQQARPSESPIKKTRSTPRRPQAPVDDKENAPPVSDSPASRTRSKAASSTTTLSSPLQPLRHAPSSPEEALLGDGKGTLTLKKGRAVAKLVRDVQVLGDVSEAYGAEGSAPEGFTTQRR